MRVVDDTNPYGRVRHQRWRNGRRIKTVRWVDNTPPKRIPPKNKGKKPRGKQLRLRSIVCPETGFKTNFVWSDE